MIYDNRFFSFIMIEDMIEDPSYHVVLMITGFQLPCCINDNRGKQLSIEVMITG